MAELKLICNLVASVYIYRNIIYEQTAMLIFLTLLSVWLSTPFFLDANDTGSIKGRIIDSNGPVAQANIALKGTTRGDITDEIGSFAINELRPGTYTLVVSVIGYRRLEREVKLSDGQVVEIELILEKMTFDLDQIVITGTMTETSIADSPVKVEVVSPKMLRMNPTGNITEALQTVNGIYNQVDCAVCGTNNLRINGMEGPYTAILIDGNPIMGSLASVYGFNGINPALIDQVEIVRGPSSTLYGSEAMGGVINIRTTNPRFAPRYVVDFSANDLSEMSVDFALAPTVGRGRTLLSGSMYHFDRFVDRNSDGFSDLTRNTRVSLFNKWSYGSLDPKGFDAYVKYYGENRMGGTSEYNRSLRGSDEIYGESIYTHRLEAAAMATLRNAASITRVQVSGSFHDQDSYYGDYGYKATQSNMFANVTNDRRLGSIFVITSRR
jgi:outer membrane receptor for ferrienterochelin and colicins